MWLVRVDGESIDELWNGVAQVLSHKGPAAVVSKRTMVIGIDGLEGTIKANDVVSVHHAVSI